MLKSPWCTARTMAPILTSFALCYSSAAISEPQVEELAPISAWQVDWVKSSCGLRRLFGTEEHPLLMQLEWFSPGDRFQLLLVGSQFYGVEPPVNFSVSFGSNAAFRNTYYQPGKSQGGTASIFITNISLAPSVPKIDTLPTVTPEMEAAITRISFAWRNRQVVLATGSLDQAFAEIRKCTDQLVRSWGLDPAAQRSRSRPPVPASNPGTWMRAHDYPLKASASGALINFRLSVDENGMPTECEVQSAYAGKDFEETTCRLLVSRARFQPALDATGKAIASYYTNSVSWIGF